MSATTVARKRGKPATGARVGAAAGKRRRKADSAGDRGKTKGGGKMNEEISSDSENERILWHQPSSAGTDFILQPPRTCFLCKFR
ncbi:U3 small nucleolar RNA-interacting protein 2-like isoform 1-T1 [Hipposideros larvatus]